MSLEDSPERPNITEAELEKQPVFDWANATSEQKEEIEKEIPAVIPKRSYMYVANAYNYFESPNGQTEDEYLHEILGAIVQDLQKEGKSPEEIKAAIHEELSEYSPEEIRTTIQGWIDRAKDPNLKKSYEDYLQKFAAEPTPAITESSKEKLEEQPKSLPDIAAEKSSLKKKTTIKDSRDMWALPENIWEDPKFKEKTEYFLKQIKADFDSWEDVLTQNSKLVRIAQNSRLTTPQTFHLLGREILQNERQKYLHEFETALDTPRKVLEEYALENKVLDAKGLNKARILRRDLLTYVQSHPLPSDNWKKQRRRQEQGEEFEKESTIIGETRPKTFNEQREMEEKEFGEFLALKYAEIAATQPLSQVPVKDIQSSILKSKQRYNELLEQDPTQK